MGVQVREIIQSAESVQDSRDGAQRAFLFNHGKTTDKNIHSVYSSIPDGFYLGMNVAMLDGRNFSFCKNTGAADIIAGQNVTAGVTVYDIDATNEVIIASEDRRYIDWYLGGSGTTITNAIIRGMIGVISSTGIGVSRRIIGFEQFAHIVSSVVRVAYRVKLDVPLNIDLAATSVLKVIYGFNEVTLYDAEAAHNSLTIIGGSAADDTVEQNEYFFVQRSGLQLTKCQGTALVAGKSVKGSATAGDDGSSSIGIVDQLVPDIGVGVMAVADDVVGFMYRMALTGMQE